MRKITSAVYALIIALSPTVTSCSPKQGLFEEDTPTGRILGTVMVINGSYDIADKDTVFEGKRYAKGDTLFYDYIGNNIEAEINKLPNENDLYNIVLFRICFSNHMPVTIDMTIPRVSIDTHGVVEGDSIVPYAGILGEYPRYTIRNLRGKVIYDAAGNPAALNIDMRCGRYQTNYQGTYKSDK